MMNYNQWKLITESLGGCTTLGLARPHVVGGPIGSQFEEDFEEDDDDVEEDDEDVDDAEAFQGEGDDEDDDLEGDLFGSSEDDGVEKGFPPDDSEEMDGLPTPDEEMLGGNDIGDEFGGEVPDLGGEEGDEMSFLGDIDPDMAGLGGGAEDLAGAMSGDMPGEPCPDCNAEGDQEIGDPDCETCGGEGFCAPAGDEFGGPEAEFAGPEEDEEIDQMMPMMMNYQRKYMGKDCKYMKKDGREHCSCEGADDFMSSLSSQATGTHHKKGSSGMSEDALIQQLFDPDYQTEPKAGEAGFAPQGRVGGIGGGYTQEDIKDIPVLGESTRYPTLAEYMAYKNQLKKKRK